MINSQADIQLRARTNLYPDGIIRWTNETEEYVYEGGSASQPTQEEIDTEVIRLQEEWDSQEYARNRKAEYDALNQFEMQYDDEVNGTTTWKDAIVAIKTKYPKG